MYRLGRGATTGEICTCMQFVGKRVARNPVCTYTLCTPDAQSEPKVATKARTLTKRRQKETQESKTKWQILEPPASATFLRPPGTPKGPKKDDKGPQREYKSNMYTYIYIYIYMHI